MLKLMCRDSCPGRQGNRGLQDLTDNEWQVNTWDVGGMLSAKGLFKMTNNSQ